MNTELLSDFDAAAESLEALAAASRELRVSIEERLARDIADLRLHGLDSWHDRWIHGPLKAIRTIEGLRLKLMVELDDVRNDLQVAQAGLSLLREAGRDADAQFASRRAVRLLCHEADIEQRLDTPLAHTIAAARNGIARVLEVSLRHAGREILRLSREALKPGADPRMAREALVRAEGFNQLVAESARVTGGIDVPVFLPDYMAGLRRAVSGADAGPGTRPAASDPAAAAAAERAVLSTPKTQPSLPRLRGGVIASA
jgi:hypothetical protein